MGFGCFVTNLLPLLAAVALQRFLPSSLTDLSTVSVDSGQPVAHRGGLPGLSRTDLLV